MTTNDLIKHLAQRLQITQKEAKQLLYQELNVISERLSQDNNIIIRGFGSFKLRDSRALSSLKNISFRASPRLKDFIKLWRPE